MAKEYPSVSPATWLQTIAIEDHFHSRQRFMGARAGWDGTNEVNSASNDSLAEFTLVAGNDTWGTALCLIGSGDTPVIAGTKFFDQRFVNVSSVGGTAKMRIRFAWGDSYAAGIAADDFTEWEFEPVSNPADTGSLEVFIPRLPVGTKIFGACWQYGLSGNSITFTMGHHEYVLPTGEGD